MRHYSIYFVTLAFGACMLYSFCSADDYLQVLTLSPEMQYVEGEVGKFIPPFGFFIALVFMFLVAYANRMLVRRRKREFAFYRLMGMSGWRVGRILFCECTIVGAVALAVGIVAGIVLSPVFGMLTAYAFVAEWRPALTFSPVGVGATAASFALVTLVAILASQREVRRHGIAELMVADRKVEQVAARTGKATRRSLVVGLVLLGDVYLCCAFPLLQALFLMFLIPMCAAACLGTFLVLRYVASRLPEILRCVRSFYLHGLNCFVVRQVESKVVSTCGALTWVSALVAVGVCMMGMGLGFRVAVDLVGTAPDGLPSASYAPVSFVGIYYGATFLVAAAAILALQQLSEADENAGRYASLRRMGCPESMLGSAVFGQVATYFCVPGAMAVVHDAFGFAITGAILVGFAGLGGGDALRILLTTLAGTLAVLGCYLVATFVACRRTALA
jgi:putative ABC transport system permease protein